MNTIQPAAPPVNSAKDLAELVSQVVKLTPEQQRRLTDVALGMIMQKEIADKKSA